MKKEKMLKLVLVIIMGIMLVCMTTNVYALSDDDFLDISNTVDTDTTTEPDADTSIDLNTEPTVDLNTNTEPTVDANANANYNTNLPEAGAVENTMIGVAVTILAVVAVYAYRKVKYYKNI